MQNPQSSIPMQRRATAAAGDLVRVRGERWRITHVSAYERCQALTLTGAGPANSGIECRVLAPFDAIDPIRISPGFALATRARWRRACAALLASHGPTGQLLTPVRGRFELMPHQLEPALAILRGLTCRVMVADDVGLGKTVEGALIAAELLERGSISRVLVLTPAGLREQWADELNQRFALPAVVLDALDIRRRIREMAAGENPWQAEPLVIASIDFVKRAEVLPAVHACRWDLVVVDEAHALASGSDRYEAANALCRAASFVVLLTATPHNGDPRAFRSLCDVGRHADEGASGSDALLVFRRTRADVRQGVGRRIRQALVEPSDAERHLYAVLDRLAQRVRRDAGAREAWGVMTVLYKRALSSAAALQLTVARRLEAMGAGVPVDVQLGLPFEAGEGDPAGDDPPAWSVPLLEDEGVERLMIRELEAAARAAAGRETKCAALVRLLRRLRRRGESAIVFTEYRDTLLHVQQALPVDSVVLHGALGREARLAAITAFNAGRVGVLLATDAAGEGLNLQHACRLVINLELPWNPVRLEQRLGRVDRIGQARRVHAIHLIARNTGEHRLLERLRRRVEQARRDIGSADPLGSGEALSGDSAFPLINTQAASRAVPWADWTPDPIGPQGGGFRICRLVLEASDEQRRLERARRLRSASDRLESAPTRPLLAAARGGARRRRRGRCLVLGRSVLEDVHGHVLASCLTGVTTSLWRRDADGRTVADLLCGARLVRAALAADPALRTWRRVSVDTHRRSIATRLVREDAIVRYLSADRGSAFQPALFDRRAEDLHEAEASRHAALLTDAVARREAVAAAADVRVEPPRPLLILLP